MRTNAGELPDRRTRRSTVMSPLSLASTVVALTFALAVNMAYAQSPGTQTKRADAARPADGRPGLAITITARRRLW